VEEGGRQEKSGIKRGKRKAERGGGMPFRRDHRGEGFGEIKEGTSSPRKRGCHN